MKALTHDEDCSRRCTAPQLSPPPSLIPIPEFSTLPSHIDPEPAARRLDPRWQACKEGLQALFADAPHGETPMPIGMPAPRNTAVTA